MQFKKLLRSTRQRGRLDTNPILLLMFAWLIFGAVLLIVSARML